ncbi:hypothetical protein [Phytopseudomonas dryadis]|uniref:Uncharacterized protein n=1 Tax=Phytopseudomonas dryadis TaxID=2487520 RepID=A0A4Q9R622_9GAMM|nr:hypothetical protein [Pseudomonas dryadis]TBU95470.1 hypothetical protein DNK44_07890 [Pseudomonas dryadis]
MLAVAFFLALLIYLLLSFFIAKWASRLARRFGWRGWSLGIPAFVVMLGLVFWDWIPMEVTYRYYCNNKAGFTQYKTIEQWREENPDAWEVLVQNDGIPREIGAKNDYYYTLNQRFLLSVSKERKNFHVLEERQVVLDALLDEALVEFTTYRTDFSSLGEGTKKISDYKFWMYKRSCANYDEKVRDQWGEFNKYVWSIKDAGK